MAFCRPVKKVHFGLLEVVLYQERCMFGVIVILEDKTTTQTQFCCFSFKIFSFHLDKIHRLIVTLISSFYTYFLYLRVISNLYEKFELMS